MGICIANGRLNMESGKSEWSPNVMTKPLCASPNKQDNLADECNLFQRIKKWTNLGPEDKFIRCSVSTLDLSPLSNTQPSPKDSGVDVSSPPRRDEEACFGMANNTTMSDHSMKTGCANKSRFYHCDRKKTLDIKELQAKEFRKIISEPRTRKKNAISVKKLKSECVKIPDKNYTVVPVARKDSGIIIKIMAKNDSSLAAKKKNQNKSMGPKNACKAASRKVAQLAEKTPDWLEKKSQKLLHGTKVVGNVCESTEKTSPLNVDQQSAAYKVKKSCDSLDISSSPKKRQSADESYTLTSVKKQKSDNPNNDLDILKIKISCNAGLLKLKPTRPPCSVPRDINGPIEKITLKSSSARKSNKLFSRTTDNHLNDSRVDRERKVKFSGSYSHGGSPNQGECGPDSIVKHVPAKVHNSSTGLLKLSQDYASIESKSSPPRTNNQVDSLQTSQLERNSPKMSPLKNSCTPQTNSTQNPVSVNNNKKTKLLNSTDHKVSPSCSEAGSSPNEPRLSNVRTIFLPGGKRKINLFLRPPKQEDQDVSNISAKSNLEFSKPELNANSDECRNSFFTDDLTDSSTSDLNSSYELKPFLLENNKIKIRKKRIPALKLAGMKVDGGNNALKNETDDKTVNNICKNNFSSAMCVQENDSGESRTFCNDEVSANETFTTNCSLNRSSTSNDRSLDPVVCQSEKQRKRGQNIGNNSLLSSEDINCDMQNKEKSVVLRESERDVCNSSCSPDKAAPKSTEKLTHEERNDVKTLKIKRKKKAEKLAETKKCIHVEPVVKKEPKWKKKNSPLEKLVKNVLDLPEKFEVYDPEMNIKCEVNWDSLNYTNAAQPALKVEKNDVSPGKNFLLGDGLMENKNVCFSEANTGQGSDDGKNAGFGDFVAMSGNEVCEKVVSNERIELSNEEMKANEYGPESDHNAEMKEIQQFNEGNDEKKEFEQQNYEKFIEASEKEGPKYCENVIIPEENEFVAVKEMSECGQTGLVKSEKDETECIQSHESVVLEERKIVSKEIELLSFDQMDDRLPCEAALLVFEDSDVMRCGVIPNNGDGERYVEGVLPEERTIDLKSVVNPEEQFKECDKATEEEKLEISAFLEKESNEINKQFFDDVVESCDLDRNEIDDSRVSELERECGGGNIANSNVEDEEIDELLKCFAISSEESYLLDQESDDLSQFEMIFNECHPVSEKMCDPLIGKDSMFEDRLLSDESAVKSDKNCRLISEDLLEGVEPVLKLIDDKRTELVEDSLLLTLELDSEQKKFAATDITMSENREEHSNGIISQQKTTPTNSDDESKALQNQFKRTELLAETPSELNSCLFSEGDSSKMKSTDVLFTDLEAVSNQNNLTRVPKSRGRKPKSMPCTNTVDDISLKVTELPPKTTEMPQTLTDTPAERIFLPEFDSEMPLKCNSRKKVAGEHHSERSCDGLPVLTGRKSARLSRKMKKLEPADSKIEKEVVENSIHSSETSIVFESNGDVIKNQNQEIAKVEEMNPLASGNNQRNQSVKGDKGAASELSIGRKSIHNDSGGILTQTEELPLDCCEKNAEKLLSVELPSIKKNYCDPDEKVRQKHLNSNERELTISTDTADQKSSKPGTMTRKRSKTNEDLTDKVDVLPCKMNKNIPASTKDVPPKSCESKLLSPRVKKPDTMHGVKYISASNAGNKDIEDVICLSDENTESKNSENGLPSNAIELEQMPGHKTLKPNVMETNGTEENTYKDTKTGKQWKSRRQSLPGKKAVGQFSSSSTKVSAKQNSDAAKSGKAVLGIGAIEELLKTDGDGNKRGDGEADVKLTVSAVKKTRSRVVNEKFDKSVRRVVSPKCSANKSIPESNDVIDDISVVNDQKTKTISKKLPKSPLNPLPNSDVFESIVIDSDSSCDTVFNYCEINNAAAKKKFIKRPKRSSSKSASVVPTSDEIVDSKLKREPEATVKEENSTNPVGFLNEFAKFLQTSNLESPSDVDKLESSGHGMPLLENCDAVKSERLPELEIVPVLDVLIPHSALSPQLPLSGTSRKVRNINQVVRRQSRIFRRASLSPQMEAFARESRTEIGKKCISWQESEESTLPSYDKSEKIQPSEEIACETCPGQTVAYSRMDETEVEPSQFQVRSNEAEPTRIAIEHDLKTFVTDQTRLVGLRNKAYKLFCCLFPGVQLPLRLSPDSEAVEQLVDSVSAIMGIDEPAEMLTLPSNDDRHRFSPEIVLCRRPLVCYRRLRRKLQRLLIQILPELDLTSDICEEIVEQLIDRVIEANSQPDDKSGGSTNAGILKRPRNAPSSQLGHDFESPDPFDALPDLTAECSYVSSGSKTSYSSQELNEYLDPPMLTAIGSRDF